MGIERVFDESATPEGRIADGSTFTAEQMSTVVSERDQYRQALYEATNKALTGSDKVADALNTVDTLHRELHTTCGERDTARKELKDADRLLDSPVRTIIFGARGIIELSRDRVKAHRRACGSYTRYEPRRKKLR